MNWQVELTKFALKQLQEITDNRVRDNLFKRIEELANDPENQGKPLRNELSGLQCVSKSHWAAVSYCFQS